jgi:hypothetical protein
MRNNCKAIYGSSEIHPGEYKLQLWTVSPEGKGILLQDQILSNQLLLSRFNTWITKGWLCPSSLSDLELELLEDNGKLTETTIFLRCED